ncbi:ABC transporter ATP-binding protein [Vreelandella alkaliphila]|uniref:ABC transporter ATP-binding protein n=1 Tax=Vreelandella alkaliphila TaxID=272774 RepID=UPI003FD849AB
MRNFRANTSAPRLLYELAASHRLAMVVALLITFLAVLAELLPFWLLYQAISTLVLTPHRFVETLPFLAAWLAAALLLKYLFYGSAYLISHHVAYAIMATARNTLVANLVTAPLPWLHGQGSGALKQSVIQDVERLEGFLAHHTIEITAAILAPLCVTALLFWLDWRLALAVLAIGPVALFVAMLGMRGVGNDHDQFSLATANLNNVVVEYLRNMPVLKVFCRSASHFQLLQSRLQAYYQLTTAITRRTVPVWSLFTSVLGAHMLLVLPLGAWLCARGEVSSADVALALMLGAAIFKPLLKVSRFFMEIPPILAGLRRMAPILALPVPPPMASRSVTFSEPPLVELRVVDMQYGGHPVLAGVSLCLRPRSLNVLVGPSGAGKSTIAHIMAGLLMPCAGGVFINARPMSQLSDSDRARLVGMATQEVFLFSGTIRENLCLARPDASEAELDKALRVAQAEALVCGLPEGLDTQVAELGTRLSGGEGQRIALARVLLADTPILLLDEATAFADSLTQRAFFRDLRQAYPGKTFVIVAHRLAGIECADQILVIEEGRLTASGRHNQLMQRSGYYQSMMRCEASCSDWTLTSERGDLTTSQG